MPRDPIIGRCLFLDGIERDVYRDPDGAQYIDLGRGEREYGSWLEEPDEAELLAAGQCD